MFTDVEVIAWLKASYHGVPHWVVVLMCAWVFAERMLGGSKNPQIRSTLAAFATLIRWVLVSTRIALIPVVGPAVIRVLEITSGVDIDGDGSVGSAPEVEQK